MVLHQSIRRLAVPVIAGGIAVFGLTGGASANKSAHGEQLSSRPGTVVVKGVRFHLRFSSTTIKKGQPLRIVNHTNPHEPHTLSLVEPGLVPHGKSEYKACYKPGGICREIFKWHGASRQGIKHNPVRVGPSGWSTEGDLDSKGDSVFFQGGNPANREVHAPHGAVLSFICGIHPWMHGTVTVK